jgi:geranylgeranyl diphosphate synthase type I
MEYLERRRSLVDERLEAVLDDVEPETLAAEVKHVAHGDRVGL